MSNGINMLNNAKKIAKELTTKLQKVRIAFAGLLTRKDKKNLHKNITGSNKRLKNYCAKRILLIWIIVKERRFVRNKETTFKSQR